MYNPRTDEDMLTQTTRSLNLFDFSNGKISDFHLLDDFSDATQFGGETESQIMLIEDPDI